MSNTVTLNAATLTVTEKTERPEQLRMTIDIGARATHPATGETVDIVGCVGNPFVFILRGKSRYGEIDFQSMIQEALTHIMEPAGK